jgi:hypothetical protein
MLDEVAKIEGNAGLGRPKDDVLRSFLKEYNVDLRGDETSEQLKMLFDKLDDTALLNIFNSTPECSVRVRTDPFSRHTTLISPLRGTIVKKDKPDVLEQECILEGDRACNFDYDHFPLLKTRKFAEVRYAKPDFSHPSIVVHNEAQGIFSVMNPNPYTMPLYVTMLTKEHTKKASGVAGCFTQDVLEAFVRSGNITQA